MRTKAQVLGKFGGPLLLAAPTVWHVYLPAGTEVPARLRKKGDGTADLLLKLQGSHRYVADFCAQHPLTKQTNAGCTRRDRSQCGAGSKSAAKNTPQSCLAPPPGRQGPRSEHVPRAGAAEGASQRCSRGLGLRRHGSASDSGLGCGGCSPACQFRVAALGRLTVGPRGHVVF